MSVILVLMVITWDQIGVNYFRSTKAQNTISINGEDQAEQVGPFIWKNVNSSKLHWVGKLGEYEAVIAKFDWAHKFHLFTIGHV